MGENVSSLSSVQFKGVVEPEFDELVEFIQTNDFNIVIVEGPRGSGKTTLCAKLLQATDLIYYKTWGGQQSGIREQMQETLNLDLPQGTYFVLDFLRQVPPIRTVLADRGNLSAIAYQRELPYSTNSKLHEYYVGLMRESKALLLELTVLEDTLLKRRLQRAEQDELRLYNLEAAKARAKVKADCDIYEEALDKMIAAGLEEAASFELDEDCFCWAYVAKGTKVNLLPEKLNED